MQMKLGPSEKQRKTVNERILQVSKTGNYSAEDIENCYSFLTGHKSDPDALTVSLAKKCMTMPTIENTDTFLETLWEQVRRASVDENGIITSRVLIWDEGTKLDEILSWFDKRHSLGALYLQFGEENSYDEDELQLTDDENVDVLSFVLKFAYETDFSYQSNQQRLRCLIAGFCVFHDIAVDSEDYSVLINLIWIYLETNSTNPWLDGCDDNDPENADIKGEALFDVFIKELLNFK